MHQPRSRRLCVATLVLLPLCASAMDYRLDSALRYDASHDDNLQLSERRLSAFGQTASAQLITAATSERTSANLDAQIWARRYNRSGFDSDDQTVKANLAHTFERTTLGLGLGAVRDSTLTSELLDSGRLQDAQRHEQYTARPSWSYQWSETDSISLQGSYLTSHYRGTSYSDYRYWQTQLLWTHSLSERLRSFVALSYSDYQSQPKLYAFDQSYATSATDRGVQLGGDYQFTENFMVSLMAGASRNHTDAQVKDPNNYCAIFAGTPIESLFPLCSVQDSDSSLTTLDGSLTWNGERNQLSANVSRSTQPSSDGYLQQSDQLDLQWHHRLWEYGTLGVAVTAGTVDIPNEQSASSNARSRDYGYATLTYTHALSEEWQVDCNLRYRTQKYDGLDRVDSSVAFIGFTWKPFSLK